MKKLCLGFTIIFCCSFGMEQKKITAQLPLFHAPGDIGPACPVRHDNLQKILPVGKCGREGVIETLIARPASGWRSKPGVLKLCRYGVHGDHRKKKYDERKPHDKILDKHKVCAVTMMRADVSDAFNGAPVPGDDLHVRGLDLGERTLQVGDLIVIKNAESHEIKVVLLKTFVEYYANHKIRNRCGDLAYDFLQCEGKFENTSHYGENRKHGLIDRLRGVQLAVLMEGEVMVGDQVLIPLKAESDDILKTYGLIQLYNKLLDRSMAVAGKLNDAQRYAKMHRFSEVYRMTRSCCENFEVPAILAGLFGWGVIGYLVFF